MTILSVVKNVCLAVGIDVPDAVMSNSDREMQEMVRVANDMAAHIRDVEYDWQALQQINTITGDGVTDAWDLPEDYARMNTKSALWSSRWTWGLEKINSTDEWLELIATGFVPVTGQWIIYGNQLHVLPVIQISEIVRFVYISNLIVKQQGGALVTGFTADTDTFRLSERVLELGMIWKWNSNKGKPDDDEQDAFDQALYTAMNNDKGSKPVISGNSRKRFDARTAFPYRVGGA